MRLAMEADDGCHWVDVSLIPLITGPGLVRIGDHTHAKPYAIETQLSHVCDSHHAFAFIGQSRGKSFTAGIFGRPLADSSLWTFLDQQRYVLMPIEICSLFVRIRILHADLNESTVNFSTNCKYRWIKATAKTT